MTHFHLTMLLELSQIFLRDILPRVLVSFARDPADNRYEFMTCHNSSGQNVTVVQNNTQRTDPLTLTPGSSPTNWRNAHNDVPDTDVLHCKNVTKGHNGTTEKGSIN